MLHFIIYDTDAQQLKFMAEMTAKWAKKNRLEIKISQFSSAQMLLAEYKPERNAIFILDLSAPENSGLSIARSLQKYSVEFHIIFVSASTEFALPAYEVHPYSYLLKPVAYEQYSKVLEQLLQNIYQHLLAVHSGHEIYNLPIMDISFVEATNRQIVFTMNDGRNIVTRDTLLQIQDILLKYPAFFKPHRSYIINMQHVEHFNSKEIAMRNSEALIPIARGLDKDFKEQYFKFMCVD